MKKAIAAIIGVIVLAGGTVLVLSRNKADGESASKNNTSYAVVEACNIFTSSIAGQILGSSAVKGTSPANQASNDDVAFSTCIYTAGPDANPPHSASVAVRSAKTKDGADSNKAMFTGTSTRNVSGYGDTAFWHPGLGQLNILKGNNWYIVSNYTDTSPANGTATLEQAEQLAKLIKLQ